MTESELSALLDAHDALVTACVDGRLTLDEFLGAYDDFPRAHALDGRNASGDERKVLRLFAKRIAFHFRVSDLVAGPVSGDGASTLDDALSGVLSTVKVSRLRQLAARYPNFEAGPATMSARGSTR